MIETQPTPAGTRVVGISGDAGHPANFGRLCSKGRALPHTMASLTGRALQPELRATRSDAIGGGPRHAVSWDFALDTVADKLTHFVREYGPDSVAFYLSGQLLTEDYYVFNKLAKGLIRTNNVDTNSRLCMSSAVAAYQAAFGADGPPTCYDDLEAAHTVMFAGSNMAYAHPVLFQRLQAARDADPRIRWICIDPRRTDTAAMADLHLAIQPGTDVALFNGMLHYLIWEGLVDSRYIAAHTQGFEALKVSLREYTPRFVADICGVPAAQIEQAAEWFGRSGAALSLYCMGLNQSAHGTDKNLALINLHLATGQLGRGGAGPFSLTGQPNAMGGREVGGMATTLAAHRDIQNPQHRSELEQLWSLPTGALSDRRGLPAVELFEALRAGKVKAVWIVCSNPVHSMPDITRVRQALQKAELVIVQDAFANTDTAACADVLLPAASWGEKEGTVTNSERRISRVRAAVAPPGEARADWWIANEVARRMEARLASPEAPRLFGFENTAQVFDEHCRLTAGTDLDMTGLSHTVLEDRGPQQWPFPAGSVSGASRRYADGEFATANRRARFHVIGHRPVADRTSAKFPLRLITGRLRDHWHGMSRTGRVPDAFVHAPEASLTMRREDAERRSLRSGDLLKITSQRGSLTLPLELSDDVASGTVFAAMHWNAQFLSSGGVNEVTTSAVDPQSFQPELKHAAVRVEKLNPGWQLLAARRGDALQLQAAVQPLLRECAYAALTLQPDHGAVDASQAWLIVRAAHVVEPPTWLQRLALALDLETSDHVLEYSDARRGVLKRVSWRPGCATNLIDGLLLAGSGAQSMLDPILAAALSGSAWPGARLSVFGKASTASKRDAVICTCMHVSESAIKSGLAAGEDMATIRARLGCGSLCGSCIPQLQRLSAESQVQVPA